MDEDDDDDDDNEAKVGTGWWNSYTDYQSDTL